eukprot:1235478-Pyramimonas_sp.AAC.2
MGRVALWGALRPVTLSDLESIGGSAPPSHYDAPSTTQRLKRDGPEVAATRFRRAQRDLSNRSVA